MTIDTEAFVAEMLPRQRAAEQAIHNGDAEPRIALWSRTDPVTVFGAKMSASGWADVEPLFRNVASWFSDSASTSSRSPRRARVATSPTRSATSTTR